MSFFKSGFWKILGYVLTAAASLGIGFVLGVIIGPADKSPADQTFVDEDGSVSELDGLPSSPAKAGLSFDIEECQQCQVDRSDCQSKLASLTPTEIASRLQTLNDQEQERSLAELEKLMKLRTESEYLSAAYLPPPPFVTGPTQTFYEVEITAAAEQGSRVVFTENDVHYGSVELAWAPIFEAWMAHLHWSESHPGFKLGETMVELYGSADLERELLAKGKAIVHSEDALWVIAAWLTKQDAAAAVLHGGGLSHSLAGELKDYWDATYEDPTELQRKVDLWDATHDVATEYSWYHNQTDTDYAYRAGRLMRRWHEAGGGQSGDDLMVLYRYHIVGLAFWAGPDVIDPELVKSWAAQVNRELEGTNLDYQAEYQAELQRIINEGYPPTGS